MAIDSWPNSANVEGVGEETLRVKHSQLPVTVQGLINEIKQGHRWNKRSRGNNSSTVKNALREKYAALIEKIGDSCKPNGYTHFRIGRNGDVVFISNNTNYGRTFKRLWGLHLPLF